MKKILLGIIVLGVIIASAAYFLNANLDSIVRTVVEKYGTAATKTAVTLDRVKIVLASGEASMEGLSIGSPSGFEMEKSLSLGNISIKLDTKSVSGSGPIVIKDITIEKPEVVYEINNKGESNLQTILRNAQAYTASFGKGKKAQSSSDSSDKAPGRKLIIESLTIRDGQLSIAQAMLKDKKIDAPFPAIRLTNIGKGEGASPAEIAQAVLSAVTNAADQVASTNLGDEVGKAINKMKSGEVSGDELEKAGGQVLEGLFGK